MLVLTNSTLQLRNFVLVAGYDHRGNDASRVDFAKLTRNHAAMLRNSTGGPVRITLFDVARGIVEEQIADGQDVLSVRVLAQYEPIRPSHYEVQASGIPAFRATGIQTLSIVDVYGYILQIGAREPSTLLELAFVCHGWGGGPILVNSFDPAPSLGLRNVDDKDGRANKDFAAPTMSIGERRLFQAAFCTKAGRVFNFGCANDAPVRDVLDQLCQQWEPTHHGTHEYEFVFNNDQLTHYFRTDPEFFRDGSLRVNRSLAQCQAFLHRRKIASYSQRIANVAGVGCWAAFPGTSSSYEEGVPFPVMSIRRGPAGSGKDYASHLRFIKLCLGHVEDDMGRGFIEFAPCHLEHEAIVPMSEAESKLIDPEDANARSPTPAERYQSRA